MPRPCSLLCGSLLLLAACGGGGGSGVAGAPTNPGPPPFQAAGAYHTAGLSTNGTTSNTSYFGTATLDALGGVTGLAAGNRDGMLSPTGPAPYTGDYAVEPDGSLLVGTLLGGYGAMSGDKNAAVCWGATGMHVMVRRGGTYDASSLQGTYRFVARLASSSSTLLSIGGTIQLDGIDAGTFMPEFLNNEGALGGTADDPLTYTVSPAGDVTIDIRGLQTLQGGVSRGGELLSLAGGAAAGQDPMVVHAIRVRTGASAADLSGEYVAVLQRLAQTSHDDRQVFGVLTADGSTSAALRDYFVAGAPQTTSVAVDADGLIDLVLPGGYRVQGALSAAGDVAFLAGGVDDGDDPGLMILVRKTAIGAPGEIPVDRVRSASLPQSPPFGASLSDVAASLLTRRLTRVGEIEEVASVPGVFVGQGERTLLQFDLSRVDPTRTVLRVELVTVQSTIENAPFALGPLTVDHVAPLGGAAPIFADYDPPRRPLGTLGVLATGPSAASLSLDVTAAVLADVADARATSAFLVYFPTQENGDAARDRLVLDDHSGTGSTAGARTRLVVTYQ